MTKVFIKAFSSIALLNMAPVSALANDDTQELYSLSMDELFNLEVTTAAKIPESWAQASASITVLRASDIKKSAARNLYELLRSVPGMSVDYDGRNIATIDVRGFRRSPILYMLNGHSLSGVVSGDAKNISLINLPLNNIKRIEVVRGPGSALYGANAIIGIVNIVTYHGDELEKAEMTVSTELESEGRIANRYSVLTGHSSGDNWAYSVNVDVLNSHGAAQFVKADADNQSGYARNGHHSEDIQARLWLKDVDISARYSSSERQGFLGLTDYLANDDIERADNIYIKGNWTVEPVTDMSLTLSAYYDKRDVDWDWSFFPAGSILTQPGGPYEQWENDGLGSNILWTDSKSGLDAFMVYEGFENHHLVMGATLANERSYDIRHISNHNPEYLPAETDVSDWFNWSQAAKRDIDAFYIQDNWQVTSSFKASIGARLDHYSDFGSTFNPRLSLIWDMDPHHNIKLLYGSAFRAPDFGDLYARNLFSSNGNPDLKPENLDTYELSLSSQWGNDWITRITLFHSEMKDLVVAGLVAKNEGYSKTKGLETEVRYELAKDSYVMANYTYTSSDMNDGDFPEVPLHRGNLQFNFALADNVNLNMQGYFQSDTISRTGTHNGGYGVWNLSVLITEILQGVEVQLAAYNLFDKVYFYPGRSIASGYQAPGQSLGLSLTYGF